MFNIFKFWLIALGVLLSGQSWAVSYYWKFSWSATQFASAQVACESEASSVTELVNVTFNASGTVAYCNMRRISDGYTSQLSVQRYGDSCPAGTEYNALTGGCDAPEQSLCEQAQGASANYKVPIPFADSPPPDTVDVNGCLATFGGVIICGNETDGSASCTGTATITGEETGGSTPIAGPATECTYNCTADFPQTESSELPCEPTTDPATGASVCTSESHFSEPGTMTCGTANGKLVCTENPKSRSQDKVTEQTTSTTTNSDGSTSTTTTTTTSKTDCVGINGCTSSTTTETKTGGTNADGSAKPDTTSCTGEGCTAPEDLPEDESGADLPSGSLAEPSERGNFDAELAEWDQLIADSRVDLRSKLDQMAELVTAETALSLSDTSGRLYCQSVPVAGTTFDICLDDYQDELVGIKWILIFMATVLAFYIIFVRD